LRGEEGAPSAGEKRWEEGAISRDRRKKKKSFDENQKAGTARDGGARDAGGREKRLQ